MIRSMSDLIPSWADAELTHDLPRLVAAGETQSLEFKRELPRHLGDIAKEIAAFATSNAGAILLGVDDDGEIVGIEDGDNHAVRRALRARLEGVFNLIRPGVTPSIRFAIFDGKVVMSIDVQKGNQPVYYVSSVPYHRQLTAARPMAPEEVIEAVLVWHVKSDRGLAIRTEFHTQLANFWRSLDQSLAQERIHDAHPWLDPYHRWAKLKAEQARRLALSAPQQFEALSEPLKRLADALETLADEDPVREGRDPRAVQAIKDAEDILGKLYSHWLSPNSNSKWSD